MIKIDLNDLDKFFVKGDLIPAICYEVNTKTVLMLAYMNKESLKKHLKQAIHGSGAVHGRNTGTRVQQADTFRKSYPFTVTVTMIPCL